MFRIRWRSPLWRGLLAIVLSMPLLAVAVTIWRASHATEEARAEVLGKSEFPVRVFSINRVAAKGVEPIAASPGFRDIVAYRSDLALQFKTRLFL